MSDKKDKKKFKDSGLVRFLKDKVAPVAGDVTGIIGKVVTGQWQDAIEETGDLISGKKDQPEFSELHLEFEKLRVNFELELQRIDLETFKAEIEDRSNARSREIEFMKASGGRDWMMGAVVIFTLLASAFFVVVLSFYRIPEENHRLFDVLLGAITGSGLMAVLNYYLGSSRDSRKKTDAIINISKNR